MDGKEVREIEEFHRQYHPRLAWSPDSTRFAAVWNWENCKDGGFQVFSAASKSILPPRTLELVPRRRLVDLAWSSRNTLIVVGREEKESSSRAILGLVLRQADVGPFGDQLGLPWRANASTTEDGACFGQQQDSCQAQATHTDVGIRVDARNIWWDLLPCAAERNMHGKRWLDLRNLSVHWHQEVQLRAGEVCAKLAGFRHLQDLRLDSLQSLQGTWACDRPLPFLRRMALLDAQQIRMLDLHQWLALPELRELDLSGSQVALFGSPFRPSRLSFVAFRRTNLTEILLPEDVKTSWWALNLSLDLRENPFLDLPYPVAAEPECWQILKDAQWRVCFTVSGPLAEPLVLQAMVGEDGTLGARVLVERQRLCAPGSVWRKGKRGGSCSLCPDNTFTNTDSLSHHQECSACPSSQQTLGPGSTSCVCEAGYVDNASICLLCSELEGGGAFDCSQPNVSLAAVPVQEGFWRSSASLHPLRCAHHGEGHACRGGAPGQICLPGHEGPKCRQCAPQHFLRNGLCRACTTEELKRALTPKIAVGVVLSLALPGLAAGAVWRFWPRKRVRQDLLRPPAAWDALRPCLVREVLAAVQVVQLFGVLSQILPQKQQRSESKVLSFLQLNLNPDIITDSLHPACFLGFTRSRMAHLLCRPLLPVYALAVLYVGIRVSQADEEKRSKLWVMAQVQVINLLLVSTVSAILAVGECDPDLEPPIMVTVPEVDCTTRSYFGAVAFALTLSCVYLGYVGFMALAGLRRFELLARPLWHPARLCYAVAQQPPRLTISFGEAKLPATLKAALLDAAQVQCRRVLDEAKAASGKAAASLAAASESDVAVLAPEDFAERRVLGISEEVAAEGQEAMEDFLEERCWRRSGNYEEFQSLAVHHLFQHYERQNREGMLRGMEVFTKFNPSSFHFLLLLKAGVVLVAYVPQLSDHKSQGAVGSFVCGILCIALLGRPFARRSEGVTLLFGLAALGLAFLLLMVSESHLNLRGEEQLSRGLQLARLLLLVPLLRLLRPFGCLVSQQLLRSNVDVNQELALLQVSWQHVPRESRQVLRVREPAELGKVALPCGSVVLPLCALEDSVRVEYQSPEGPIVGWLPVTLLAPQPVELNDLEEHILCSDRTGTDGLKVSIHFGRAVDLSCLELCAKGGNDAAEVTWSLTSQAGEKSGSETRTTTLKGREFLQYHLHCGVTRCEVLVRGADRGLQLRLLGAVSSYA
ncbi:unnamed protein product [Effrenium voratum]|uniref:Uncharacterized protein n=1 Tax=Effrenium voratum TaxID=2562239 RepID=A0AA36N8K6_9DINO|nr:unnamed protein product [Effrenium voratum]